MVRGTNKRIIEINDTQNPYFERAVLYVKDNHADSGGFKVNANFLQHNPFAAENQAEL